MGQLNCCHRARVVPWPEQQCPPDTLLPEPLLRQRVRLSRGRKRKTRELLLFADSLVIAKAKRGGVLLPQLCLALGQLMVLSGGKAAETGYAAEGEEDSSTKSLVLIWPSGSCVISFSSRAVKELWVSTLRGHRPAEGAEGAQVTQLPSLKLLLKELSSQRALLTLHSNRLERLLSVQAKVGTEQQLPPIPTGGKGDLGRLEAGGRRRRRMGLPWPFSRRQTSAAPAEAPRSSGCGARGPLFGQPLAAVCSQDGTLPQPMQDLLALLHAQGPSTEKIFCLTAGERALQEVREALDGGAEVQLERQPVHLLAAVLKDFLWKIPSKLLRSELYGEWMSALEKSSRQERLSGLREVASKLPQANLLLLKRLLSLLHNISSNAASNSMTAANLAICLGPNLLSPAEEHTLPLDMLVIQKVIQLVEFLIDHQGELFEEEEVTKPVVAEAEEVAAVGPGEVESAEVLPEAQTSEEPKSSSEHRRLPKASGDMQHRSCRKRKLSCKEERDSQPDSRRQKLERDLQGSLKRCLQKCQVDFVPVYLSSVWDGLLSSK